MWLGHIWLKTGSGGGLLWTLLKYLSRTEGRELLA